MDAKSLVIISLLILCILALEVLDRCLNSRYEKNDFDWDDDDEDEPYVPILLIDMDGVIADYYGYFCQVWAAKFPDRKVLSPEELTHMYFENCYDPEYTKDIR